MAASPEMVGNFLGAVIWPPVVHTIPDRHVLRVVFLAGQRVNRAAKRRVQASGFVLRKITKLPCETIKSKNSDIAILSRLKHPIRNIMRINNTI